MASTLEAMASFSPTILAACTFVRLIQLNMEERKVEVNEDAPPGVGPDLFWIGEGPRL